MKNVVLGYIIVNEWIFIVGKWVMREFFEFYLDFDGVVVVLDLLVVGVI